MIPGKFEYRRPSSVSEALSILANEEDAKILAGGQSLIPMMKLRFAEPAVLVDLGGLEELQGITEDNGTLIIGAMTTENALIQSELLSRKCPLIQAAARQIADPQVRNLGTVGGDIAHGDPANDHPAVMIAADAEFVITGKNGDRTVAAEKFFHGTYWTELGENEILTSIRVPAFSSTNGFGYSKLKRKTGDYATAGASVVVKMDEGVCVNASIALTNVGPTPIKAEGAEQVLLNTHADGNVVEEAAYKAMEVSDPAEDLRGTIEYKRNMTGEMTRRAVRAAVSTATGG